MTRSVNDRYWHQFIPESICFLGCQVHIPPTHQVQLTADYAPSKLMDLLTASQFYPLEAALSICQVAFYSYVTT